MPITINGSGTVTGISAGGLPDGTVAPADLTTGAPAWDSSGNLSFNSGYGSAAVAYGCRAWVNFNGTTASPSTIRASGNVSSVTKNGTGDYTVNFTNAMPDANYSISLTASGLFNGTVFSTDGDDNATNPRTNSAIRIRARGGPGSGSSGDPTYVSAAIFK